MFRIWPGGGTRSPTTTSEKLNGEPNNGRSMLLAGLPPLSKQRAPQFLVGALRSMVK